MDKSFNDQELSEIMKEIEALEEDFSEPEEKSTSSVLEELANLDEEESIPLSTSNIVSFLFNCFSRIIVITPSFEASATSITPTISSFPLLNCN